MATPYYEHVDEYDHQQQWQTGHDGNHQINGPPTKMGPETGPGVPTGMDQVNGNQHQWQGEHDGNQQNIDGPPIQTGPEPGHEVRMDEMNGGVPLATNGNPSYASSGFEHPPTEPMQQNTFLQPEGPGDPLNSGALANVPGALPYDQNVRNWQNGVPPIRNQQMEDTNTWNGQREQTFQNLPLPGEQSIMENERNPAFAHAAMQPNETGHANDLHQQNVGNLPQGHVVDEHLSPSAPVSLAQRHPNLN